MLRRSVARSSPDGPLCQLTNVLLAVECGVAALLAAGSAGAAPVATAVAFALAGVAFAVGAATHRAIHLGRSVPSGLWTATLGAGHVSMLGFGYALLGSVPLPAGARLLAWIAASWLAPLAAIVRRRVSAPLRYDEIIWIGTLVQLGGTAVIMVAAAVTTVANGGRFLLAAAATLGAAVGLQVWLKRRDRYLLGLDYNSVFHILMGLALWLAFRALA
jgi:hypothetical protein